MFENHAFTKTPLQQANRLLRSGEWYGAIQLYIEVSKSAPHLNSVLRMNVERALKYISVEQLDPQVLEHLKLLWHIDLNQPNIDPGEGALKKPKLVSGKWQGTRAAGVASIPEREFGLQQSILSLTQQVNEVHVYLNNYTREPEWLRTISNVRIYSSEVHGNIGDAGKFFGYQYSNADWYFSCDDDIIYPDDYAETLIKAHEHHGFPVGVHGSLLKFPTRGYYDRSARHVFHFKWKNEVDRRVHILGTGTLLLKREQIPRLPRFDFSNMADIWVAKFLAESRIPMYAISRSDGWLREAGSFDNAIYENNKNELEITNQRLLVDHNVQTIGAAVRPIKGSRKKILFAIKTFNRLDYLKACITSFCQSACADRFDIVVAVADDGSTDGSIEYLQKLNIPYELHILAHQRVFVGGQFNALVRLGRDLNVDFYFIVDDDLFFKKKGWMSGYFDAASQSGFDHLCHFNLAHFKQICQKTNEYFPPQKQCHELFPLESHTSVRRAMGALFTLSPRVVASVGFADEVNFFVRGGWHGDYSARCCRAGFNELERFWDWQGSNDFIELQNTREASYRSAIEWDSADFIRASSPDERRRREAIRDMSRRVMISEELATSGPFIMPSETINTKVFTVNDVFDQVFVINLDRRTDRLEKMDSRLKKLNIVYERFAAVDGTDRNVMLQYESYRASRTAPRPEAHLFSNDFYFGGRTDAERTAHIELKVGGPGIRSAGALAYLLTYRKILRLCIEKCLNKVLILDDDCLFHKNFSEGFTSAIEELPLNWRMFQLGTMQYNWTLTRTYSKALYLPRGVLVASHAVGLHRDTFPILLEGIDRQTLPLDIGPLQDCGRIFKESSFVCTPNLIIQDQSESDINSSEVAKEEAEKSSNTYRWVRDDYF